MLSMTRYLRHQLHGHVLLSGLHEVDASTVLEDSRCMGITHIAEATPGDKIRQVEIESLDVCLTNTNVTTKAGVPRTGASLKVRICHPSRFTVREVHEGQGHVPCP